MRVKDARFGAVDMTSVAQAKASAAAALRPSATLADDLITSVRRNVQTAATYEQKPEGGWNAACPFSVAQAREAFGSEAAVIRRYAGVVALSVIPGEDPTDPGVFDPKPTEEFGKLLGAAWGLIARFDYPKHEPPGIRADAWTNPKDPAFRQLLAELLKVYPEVPAGRADIETFDESTARLALVGMSTAKDAKIIANAWACAHPQASYEQVSAVWEALAKSLQEEGRDVAFALMHPAWAPLAQQKQQGATALPCVEIDEERLLALVGAGKRLSAAIRFLLDTTTYAVGLAAELQRADVSSALFFSAEKRLNALYPCSESEVALSEKAALLEGEQARAQKEADLVAFQASQERAEAERAEFVREAKAWGAKYKAWSSAKSGGGLGPALALAAAGFVVGGPVGAAVGGGAGLVLGGESAAVAPTPPTAPVWMPVAEQRQILAAALA